MAKKTLPQAVKELLSEAGLPNAVYVGEWENQAVYHPVFGDGQPSVGLPSYILYADGEAYWTEPGEGFKILEHFMEEEQS